MKLGPNQQKWIDALKSGDYKQTKSALQNKDGYCCLGLACIMVSECNFCQRKGYLFGQDLSSQPDADGKLGLRGSVGRIWWAGEGGMCRSAVELLRERGYNIPAKRSALTLTTLNDEHGVSFMHIGELLETFPALYFKDSR